MRRFSSADGPAVVITVVCAATLLAACRSGEPRTDAEKLARGREIVQRFSDTLGAAKSFTVTTTEALDEVRPGGKTERVTLTRDTTVRRPDRLYSKVSGSRQNEVWYDGVGLTLVLHDQKAFGQARAPETLDKALDALHERYGITTAIADYVYSAPAKALLSATTTGGWAGRETIGGTLADHLAFKDTGVTWDLWVPAQGAALPIKAAADFTANPRQRHVELTFSNWNLSPEIADTRFTPTVPADYEGIAILQRARILRNLPADDTPGSPADAKK